MWLSFARLENSAQIYIETIFVILYLYLLSFTIITRSNKYLNKHLNDLYDSVSRVIPELLP